MRAFVFPGQGSQKVGMGVDLAAASPAAREVFQEVDDALGQKLSAIMAEGPEDALTLTENAQPAIMANAIAVLRVLEREGGITLANKADFVAGHSLGEYTALCAAGAFSLADTARLLKLRGQAMQAAVPVGVGAMAALLGADIDKATRLAEAAAEGQVCTVANDNDPTQVVISGHREAVERARAHGFGIVGTNHTATSTGESDGRATLLLHCALHDSCHLAGVPRGGPQIQRSQHPALRDARPHAKLGWFKPRLE